MVIGEIEGEEVLSSSKSLVTEDRDEKSIVRT